jgi:1,4-dihydroxy-2-naphthoate octaprenyltransferase
VPLTYAILSIYENGFLEGIWYAFAMKDFLTWSRSPFFLAILIPWLAGTALVHREQPLNGWLFALTGLGLLAAHAGANLLNDVFDYRLGADLDNPRRNAFSGGSPHLVEGRVHEKQFLTGAVLSLAVAVACGGILALTSPGHPVVIFLLALAGLSGGILYTMPPLKLAYRGWGESIIFLCFGPLPLIGTYYVQIGQFALWPVLVSLPIGLLITAIIWINEFPDREADKRAGKRTLVVRMPSALAVRTFTLLVGGAFLLMMLLAIIGTHPGMLAGLVGVPPAYRAVMGLRKHATTPEKLVPAQGMTILAHLLAGLGMVAGLWFA